MWTELSKGQVAPQYRHSSGGKRVCERGEQLRLAIRPCTVRQHKRVAARLSRNMKESANGDAFALFRE
jgi:hypothetical protein